MASVYTRPGSSFFWISYRDPLTRKIRRESTKFSVDAIDGRRHALAQAAFRTQGELESPRAADHELWQAWVPGFLEERYAASPLTLLRAKDAWVALYAYLRAQHVAAPRQLVYKLAAGYLGWRKDAKKSGLRSVHHNTAVLEAKFLSVVMRQAVRLGFAIGNPCREVELRRTPAKQKPEISPQDERLIEYALARKDVPQWMRDHWLVLMRLGCRSTEAFTPLHYIDDRFATIRLRIKGGGSHTAPLHKDLKPLVARARAARRGTLVEVQRYAPKQWHTFFKRLGLPYSIHCTRVTVITRLLRAGYTPAEVCAYIGHSEEINVLYRRLRPADVRHLGEALGVQRGHRQKVDSSIARTRRQSSGVRQHHTQSNFKRFPPNAPSVDVACVARAALSIASASVAPLNERVVRPS